MAPLLRGKPNLLRWYIPDGFLLLLQRYYVAYPLSHGVGWGKRGVLKNQCASQTASCLLFIYSTRLHVESVERKSF